MFHIQADASPGLFRRYIKKKKLDPLETYVPLVLEAREQLASLQTIMGMLQIIQAHVRAQPHCSPHNASKQDVLMHLPCTSLLKALVVNC